MDKYIGLIFGKKDFIVTDIFNRDLLEDVPSIYHSLIQIRLLIQWVEMGPENKWKQLAELDKDNIDSMEAIIFLFSEHHFSSRLQCLWYSGNDTEIESFFLKNTNNLEASILNYVKENIHSFD